MLFFILLSVLMVFLICMLTVSCLAPCQSCPMQMFLHAILIFFFFPSNFPLTWHIPVVFPYSRNVMKVWISCVNEAWGQLLDFWMHAQCQFFYLEAPIVVFQYKFFVHWTHISHLDAQGSCMVGCSAPLLIPITISLPGLGFLKTPSLLYLSVPSILSMYFIEQLWPQMLVHGK